MLMAAFLCWFIHPNWLSLNWIENFHATDRSTLTKSIDWIKTKRKPSTENTGNRSLPFFKKTKKNFDLSRIHSLHCREHGWKQIVYGNKSYLPHWRWNDTIFGQNTIAIVSSHTKGFQNGLKQTEQQLQILFQVNGCWFWVSFEWSFVRIVLGGDKTYRYENTDDDDDDAGNLHINRN